MKLFACSHCQQVVFFESVTCVACGHKLAYLPDARAVSAMVPCESTGDGPTLYCPVSDSEDARRYRMCDNAERHEVCNWAVPADQDSALCLACSLNRTIPDLTVTGAKERWGRLEIAKRRVIYGLLDRGLPVRGQHDGAREMAFVFAADQGAQRVFTGHEHGVITINLDEADAPFRERVRAQLGEPYRTLLGHFRHEVAHYYWERLIERSPWLERFREQFGDERIDYGEARRRHYEQGPPPDWPEHFISAYASMHPWEDWAESFAHYLHVTDTLDTARSYDLALQPSPLNVRPLDIVVAREVDFDSLDELLRAWVPLTLALNSLNRGMGLGDVYPFVLRPPAVAKLRFVHDWILDVRRQPLDAAGTSR